MGLVMKPDSQWWYGDCTVAGKRHVIPLGVRIDGRRGDRTDPKFIASQALAYDAFQKARDELRTPAAAERRLRRLQEIQTGHAPEKLTLGDLESLYRNKQRRKRASIESLDQGVKRIARFVEFMQQHYPRVTDLVAVTPNMAVEFISSLEREGLSYATLNRYTESLHAAFNVAVLKRAIVESPFKKVQEFDEETGRVHRRPFTPQQVAAILALVKLEPVVAGVIVAALCTGMRRKNCALLQWSKVNLKTGMIRVQSFKTGSWQVIPILPPLLELLKAAPKDGIYCFPDAAEMYLKNPDGLNVRFNRVLRDAGILSSSTQEGAAAVDPEKERGGRVRSPSIYGFASCKTTFVTISLNSGIPEMMVRKVVGNEVVDLVLRHYYQIDEEEMKRQFLGKLPTEMTGGKPVLTAEESLARIEKLIAGMTPENLAAIQAELKTAVTSLKRPQ